MRIWLWLSGMLHDVGRFEQLRRYNTFIDTQSINHAALSASVLFDEGHIRDYIDDAAEDALLRTAVRVAQCLPPAEKVDDRTRMFCQICGMPIKSIFCASTLKRRWRKSTTSAPRPCAKAL
ncbi:HD domain-containing protein [Gemmiger formicilis]|uniref:HD domain-containing protein n=1 Tax=Gemmiger formicilis TaxID=745368 RepID=UPI0039959CDC